MNAEVAGPLHLRRRTGRPAPLHEGAQPKQKISANALLGMGLWFLLWTGYNTDIGRMMAPNFPADTMDLIHGLRSLGPMLAGWFSLIMIFMRPSRLFSWIIGPVGLMLVYSVIGLVSSATLSIQPKVALYFGGNYLAIVLVMLAIALAAEPLPDLLYVLKLTWFVGTLLTLALLGAIPFLGSQVIIPTESYSAGHTRLRWDGNNHGDGCRLETPALPGMLPSRRWRRSPGSY